MVAKGALLVAVDLVQYSTVPVSKRRYQLTIAWEGPQVFYPDTVRGESTTESKEQWTKDQRTERNREKSLCLAS